MGGRRRRQRKEAATAFVAGRAQIRASGIWHLRSKDFLGTRKPFLGVRKDFLGSCKEFLGISKDFFGRFVGFQWLARKKKKKTIRPNFSIRRRAKIPPRISDVPNIAHMRQSEKQKPRPRVDVFHPGLTRRGARRRKDAGGEEQFGITPLQCRNTSARPARASAASHRPSLASGSSTVSPRSPARTRNRTHARARDASAEGRRDLSRGRDLY